MHFASAEGDSKSKGCSISVKEIGRKNQSNQCTIFFDQMLRLFFLWLVFEGSVYCFGKPTDVNDSWIRYVRAIQ